MRLVVYNPSAGWALRGARLRRSLDVLRALPGETRCVATERTEMWRSVRAALTGDVDQIVACGGD